MHELLQIKTHEPFKGQKSFYPEHSIQITPLHPTHTKKKKYMGRKSYSILNVYIFYFLLAIKNKFIYVFYVRFSFCTYTHIEQWEKQKKCIKKKYREAKYYKIDKNEVATG